MSKMKVLLMDDRAASRTAVRSLSDSHPPPSTQRPRFCQEVEKMNKVFQTLWSDQQGQDIAEYAVMLAVILVIVVGTIRLVGSNANKVFSSVASSVQ
jgi:Flp pilus assembly pilin Flp